MNSIPIAEGWTRFSDIPCGSHFHDGNGRKFIKLVDKSAFGYHLKFERMCRNPHDTVYSSAGLFNAIDYEGYIGLCPEWCPFKIIKNHPQSFRVGMKKNKKTGKVQIVKGNKVIGEQG